jgi:hypothetical protein
MNIKINGKVRNIDWKKGMKFSDLIQPIISENIADGKLLYSVVIKTEKGPITVKPEYLKKLNDARVEGNEDIELLFKDKKDYIVELSDQVLPYIDKIEGEIATIISLIEEDPDNSNAMTDLGNIIDGISALGQTIVPIINLKILDIKDFSFEDKIGERAFEAIKDFVDSFKIKIESKDLSEKIEAISEMLPKLLSFYKKIFQEVRK